MEKKQMRQQMIEQLKQMAPHTYQTRCEHMIERLLKEPSVMEGETIAVTMSAFPEVETRGLIEKLWEMGKKIAIPKCHPQTRAMQFYEITSFSQLETVYLHIEEPVPALCEEVGKEDIDTIIVPGVVFNKEGYRIGFGGGYYDRYLPGLKAAKLALAFDEQIVEYVPVDLHDIPVDVLITDVRRLDARQERGDNA